MPTYSFGKTPWKIRSVIVDNLCTNNLFIPLVSNVTVSERFNAKYWILMWTKLCAWISILDIEFANPGFHSMPTFVFKFLLPGTCLHCICSVLVYYVRDRSSTRSLSVTVHPLQSYGEMELILADIAWAAGKPWIGWQLITALTHSEYAHAHRKDHN